MVNEISSITKHIFEKENPQDVEVEDMEKMVLKHPYFAAARYLLAKRKLAENQADGRALVTAGLYLHNPLRLHWLLTQPETATHEPEESPVGPTAEKQPVQSSNESPIAFQSYHTIDYFASQGIRLLPADLTKDKLGQQLKSFTEWLRSMKKLPSTESELPSMQEDQHRHHHVVQSAAHSIEAKEILTEAMAEVWAKQGNRERAVAIYDKLSLQNPAKSGYFASRIDQLKAL